MKYRIKIPTTIEYEINAESESEAEAKAKKMLYDELGIRPNDALGDIQTEEA